MHEAAEAVSKGMNVLRGTLGREGEKAAGSGVLSGVKETGKVGQTVVDLSRGSGCTRAFVVESGVDTVRSPESRRVSDQPESRWQTWMGGDPRPADRGVEAATAETTKVGPQSHTNIRK